MEAVSLSLAWWCYSWHTLVSPWITHTANLVLTVLHMKWCWTVQTRGPQAVPFWVTGMRWPISTRSWDRTGGIIRRFCRVRDSKSPSLGTWKSPQNGTIFHLYSCLVLLKSLFQMTQMTKKICRSPSMMPTMDDPPPEPCPQQLPRAPWCFRWSADIQRGAWKPRPDVTRGQSAYWIPFIYHSNGDTLWYWLT